MRKLIFAAVLLPAVLFLVLNLAEMQSVAQTFQRGDWRYLSIALSMQVVMFLCMAASCRTVYSIIGLKESLECLFLLVVSANFVNVVAPSAGVGGLVVFVSEACQRGYSSARVTIARVVVIFDYLAFRGITFWIPFLFGLFTFRWLSHQEAPELFVQAD